MSIKNLLEKRARAWEAAKAILDRAGDEPLAGDDLVAFESAQAEIEALSAEIDRRHKFANLDLDETVEAVVREVEDTEPVEDRSAAHERAFRSYLRGTMSDRDRQVLVEHRDLATSPGSAGGYTVPEGFWAQVAVTMKSFTGVKQAGATVITTDSGNPLPWPTVDDTSNSGEQLAEGSAATVDTVLTFGVKTLNAYTYSSRIVKVSRQLLSDTGVDLEALLARLLGERIGRIENQRFTTGTGSGQPQGIVTGSSTVAAANASSITYDDLVNLVHAVDEAYWPRAAFQMNRATLGAVRKLKDADNRPLWEPSMQAGVPSTILGHPVVVNAEIANIGTGNRSVVFADHSEAYVVREVNGLVVLRLDERYADALQVGFIAFHRADGTVNVSAASRVLLHP